MRSRRQAAEPPMKLPRLGHNNPEGSEPEGYLAAAEGRPHPRLLKLPTVRTVLDGVVPLELCRELVFILKATSSVGYRPHVLSATIHDVVTTAPWLLPPLVWARHAVLSAVEAAFGLSLELTVEFSGLISWTEGASLGWHHDANRSYLSRRHLSAVLYLNDQGVDFGGGDFRFQDGVEPLRVAPKAGRLVAYTADARNVHRVDATAWGERCTLTMWFSLDPAAAEDGKVLQQLRFNPRLQASACQAGASVPPPTGGGGALPAGTGAATAPSARSAEPAAAWSGAAADRDVCGGGGGPGSAHVSSQGTEGGGCGNLPAGGAGGCSGDPEATRGSAWWAQLAPGLPDTMYQLPLEPEDEKEAEEEEGTEGEKDGRAMERKEDMGQGREEHREKEADRDLRVIRLRRLGLRVVWPKSRHPSGATATLGGKSGAAARAPASAPGSGGGHPAGPGPAGAGDVLPQVLSTASPRQGEEVLLTTEEEGAGRNLGAGGSDRSEVQRAAGPDETRVEIEAEVEDDRVRGVWVIVDDDERSEAEPRQGQGMQGRSTAPGASQASASATPPLSPVATREDVEERQPGVLRFGSLADVNMVAQFAACMLGVRRIHSTTEVMEASSKLEQYAAAGLGDLHRELPRWVSLGALTGTDD